MVEEQFGVSAANLPRCWCSRAAASSLARSASHVGPLHNHAESALRGACSAGGRPILSTRRRARGPRVMGSRTQRSRSFINRIVNLPRCWYSSVSAGGLARSASHVGPQHNHAMSALRGACSVDGRSILFTRRRVHGPGTTGAGRSNYEIPKLVPPTSRSVGAVEPQPMTWGSAHPALANNTATPSAHCAERAPWRSTGSARRESVQFARHGTRTRWPKNDRSQYRQPAAVLVQ